MNMLSATATVFRTIAPRVGFSHFDEARARRGVGLMTGLAAIAWGMFAAAPWLGPGALTGGMALLTLVSGTLVGSVLNAAQANEELGTLLVRGAKEVAERKTVAAAQAMPPPLPSYTPPTLTMAPPPAPNALSRGDIDGRSYVLFSDGSIEMDTVFGPRWFASLDVAHEFIGYRAGADATPGFQFAARLN